MSVPTPRDSDWRCTVGSAPCSESSRAPDVAVLQAERVAHDDRLSAAVATSPGRLHAVNEDCHSRLDGADPLFVVADGVGGGALASRASRELVARLHGALGGTRPDSEALRAALLDADRAIERSIARRGVGAGAATVALCTGLGASLSRWLVAWVGDCRVYRLAARPDAVAQLLTVDDTYRHLHEAPPPGGSPDDPARMVGNGAVDAPNVRGVELHAGEMLVLCSDGVHKHATAADIGRLLREPAPLARRCTRLIELARARGSHDDATVLVVQRRPRGFPRHARLLASGMIVALLAVTGLWLGPGSSAVQQLLSYVTSSQSGVQR